MRAYAEVYVHACMCQVWQVKLPWRDDGFVVRTNSPWHRGSGIHPSCAYHLPVFMNALSCIWIDMGCLPKSWDMDVLNHYVSVRSFMSCVQRIDGRTTRK